MKAFFEEEGRLKKFLGKDGNICREERQFALFLYLVFLKKKREETRGENGGYIEKTVRKCLALEDSQDIEIIDVYYEVSMMRDYWNYFKKDKKGGGFAISEKVLHFCLDFQRGAAEASEVVDQLLSKNQNLRSNYLGQNLWQEAVREHYGVGDLFERERDSITDEEKRKMRIKAGLDIAKMMMNATPDILVVYKLNDRLYAKAIECKYKSKAGKYRDIAGVKSRMQLFIQECIMCFCFGTNEYTDEQKRHIPHPPESPVWKKIKDENSWEETCHWVYKGILNQNMETGGIKNGGVELVRFTGEDKETEEGNDSEQREIKVGLKELLENMY